MIVAARQASIRAWGPAHGPPVMTGKIRSVPADFLVVEQLGFRPDETGQHALLRVRKTGANTEWVARELAAVAGVGREAVGYAGRKDRHAVAEQWFSVDLGARSMPDWQTGLGDAKAVGIEVLAQYRHRRKLRLGALTENAFHILIRDVRGKREAIDDRLAKIAAQGVPNYFGLQRFGHQQANLADAEAWFRGSLRPKGRNQRAIWLSAARGALFNDVLADRIETGDWSQALDGDLLQLDGRNSWFRLTAEEDHSAINARLQAMAIHPTGPLWGRGGSQADAMAAEREHQAVRGRAVLRDGLEAMGLAPDRRALRVRVRELRWQWAPRSLRLSFSLRAGSFATAVLAELMRVDGVEQG